jgi:2-succinyl-5-enolpyruvyl-6-hydroxy-3-cyclohexene-1-carboxylate synthase
VNPSTAQATVIVDELVRNNVRHVVVCPGSRNAPLAMALYDAAELGRLDLHVRIDERAAGFFALGMATRLADQAGGGCVAVACTSGTAVANLHPAVLEAFHAGVPLLLLTADRPPELHSTGANQTIDQRGLFGPAAITVDFPVAERRAGQNQVWRGLVCRAVAQAETGRPVQVNIPFREPLVPTVGPPWPESLVGRPNEQRWTTSATGHRVATSRVDFPIPARTLMVVGSGNRSRITAAAMVAARAGWPVVAEPTGTASALDAGASVLRCGALLLAAGDLPARLRPEAVVVVGRPTLSRGVRGLMGTAPVYGIGDHPQWTDPQYVATHVRGWLDTDDLSHVAEPDPDWRSAWLDADASAAATADKVLDEQPWPVGMRLARDLVAALPANSMLFLGSSNPIRDVDLVAEPRGDLTVYANRGVAGIDGNVATALGIAAIHDGPNYALVGDLTFLHDANALLIGRTERRPDLTVVVFNDDGGGVFSLLEQGAADYGHSFERIFGTPHGIDIPSLCAAYRVPHLLVDHPAEIGDAVAPSIGPKVVEVRANRRGLRDLHERLRADVADSALR